MGRADYTEKSIERNKLDATARGEAVQSLLQPAEETAVRSEWPLSFAQQRLWFLEQLNPGNPAYNVPPVVRLKGQLNLAAFQNALEAVVRRHESLRTRFVCEVGEPAQVIDKECSVKVQVNDLSALELSQRETELRRCVLAEMSRPFDLNHDRLLRVSLFRLRDQEHLMVLTMHHIISDEWSLDIFFRELGAYYEGFATGDSVELPDLPIQYGDFACWQRDWLKGEGLEEQLRFWKEQLQGNPLALEMPTDFPRRQTVSSHGKTVARFLSKDMETSLRNLARREQATLFMVLLAAFKALLYRYTQQEDIIVRSPISGRDRLELEGLIGFFVNILPLRTNLSNNPSFKSLLRQLKEVTLAACSHQDAPFEKIVKELHPERSISETPFARVLFSLQNNSFERMRRRTAPAEGAVLDIQFLEAQTDTGKFELSINVQQTSLGLALRAEYNTGLFRPETIERLLEHFEILLGGLVADPERRLSELPMLSDAEKHQMLVDWNNTFSNYPREKSIQELFQEQAARAPEALAAIFGNSSLTYGELNKRANQLAHYLERYHFERNTPVGICVQPSVEMLVG